MLAVAPDEMSTSMITKQQWTWFKKRLSFCEFPQEGGDDEGYEGCFRLHRLPTAVEAEEIRDIVGLRKRMDLSPEALARSTARLPRRGTGLIS
jgi:hypothetical protein